MYRLVVSSVQRKTDPMECMRVCDLTFVRMNTAIEHTSESGRAQIRWGWLDVPSDDEEA